jgi:hypothetical protein
MRFPFFLPSFLLALSVRIVRQTCQAGVLLYSRTLNNASLTFAMRFAVPTVGTAPAATTGAPGGERVKIIQLIMAKCPMSTSWQAKFATTLMNDTGLRSIVDFEQTFVGGDIGEGPVNDTNWGRCFHGPSECEGHTIMLCAKNISRSGGGANISDDDYRWFDMVTCMDGKDGLPGVTYGLPDSIPNNAAKCAKEVGLPYEAIHACASGAHGAALLKASHFRTMALFEGKGGYRPVSSPCGGSCTWPDHPLGHGYAPPLIPNVWIVSSV